MLLTPVDCRSKTITVARYVAPNATCEALVWLSVQAADLVEAIHHETVSISNACMVTKRAMNIYTVHLFKSTVVNGVKADVTQRKY